MDPSDWSNSVFFFFGWVVNLFMGITRELRSFTTMFCNIIGHRVQRCSKQRDLSGCFLSSRIFLKLPLVRLPEVCVCIKPCTLRARRAWRVQRLPSQAFGLRLDPHRSHHCIA